VHPELGERARVDQQGEALSRRELVAGVLPGDLLGAATGAHGLSALLEILDQRAQRGPRLRLDHR